MGTRIDRGTAADVFTAPSCEPDGRRAPLAAAIAGAGVGVLGGLLGLGGAEFRLPILVGYFRYGLLRAVSLNLAVSLITVLASAVTRVAMVSHMPDAAELPLAASMMLGGVGGAALGARWLTHVSAHGLHVAIRTLLIGIGLLLVAESATAWEAGGLPLGELVRIALGALAGVLIGIVSTLLGVAGGELIIPTLVLAFGVPVKTAGTLSLLISIPAILVGLARHRARGAFREPRDLRELVMPMGLGTIAGGVTGALLIAAVPAAAIKLLLGAVLIVSALRVFGGRPRA